MSAVPQLADAAEEGDDYTAALRQDLRRLWTNVIQRRAPEVLYAAMTPAAHLPSPEAAVPLMQAVNIWFQLTRIIDENAAMRTRRMTEAAEGPAAVEGSFAAALSALDPQMTREDFAQLSTRLSVGPTLTAHPTEAKRVTVLEIPAASTASSSRSKPNAGPPANATTSLQTSNPRSTFSG